MSAYQIFKLSQDAVESEVQGRLGAHHHSSHAVHRVLRSDPLLSTLAASQSTQAHAESRARELVDSLYEQDSQRQVQVLQERLARSDEQVTLLQSELGALKSARESDLADLTSLKSEAERIVRAHDAAVDNSKRQADDVNTLNKELAEVSGKLRQAETQVNVLRAAETERMSAHQRSAQQAEMQSKELKAALHALQQQLQCVTAQAQTSADEASKLRETLSERESALLHENSQLKTTVAKLQLEQENNTHAMSDFDRKRSSMGTQLQQLKEANSKLRSNLREAEGLLRRSDRDRSELRNELARERQRSQMLLTQEAESRERVERESAATRAEVSKAIQDLESLDAERSVLRQKLQEMMQKLEEEARAKAKLLQRQERQEESLLADIDALRAELATARQDLECCQRSSKEQLQQRDMHLAAAETQALQMKGHIQQLESDLKRATESMTAKEKELHQMFDEKLHLELKQQQLRYDRRLQELDFESRGRLLGAGEQPHQIELLRKVLGEENERRNHANVDQSVRDLVNQQLSTVLKEITNHEDLSRAMDAKLQVQQHTLAVEHEKQMQMLRKQHEDQLKEVHVEAMKEIDNIERKGAESLNRMEQVQGELLNENEKLQGRLDELQADIYLLRQDNFSLRKQQENMTELEAAKADAELGLAALEEQIKLEQQAHTHTQQREATIQKHYQDAVMQMEVRTQELQALNQELQGSRTMQHETSLQVAQLQHHVDGMDAQRGELEETNQTLRDALVEKQRMHADLQERMDRMITERDRLQEALHQLSIQDFGDKMMRVRRDIKQEVDDNLRNLNSMLKSKVAAYRNMLQMLTMDVRSHMEQHKQDQAATIKRAVYRIQQAMLRQQTRAQAIAEESTAALKEKLFASEQALRSAHRQIEELTAQQGRVAEELTQISELSSDNMQLRMQLRDSRVNMREVEELTGEVKSQQQHALRTMQKLQQDKACAELERDDLMQKITALEAIFSEHQRRFLILMHVLVQDLEVPEEVLATLSDSSSDVFEAGIEEVKLCILTLLERQADGAARQVEETIVAKMQDKLDALQSQLEDRQQALIDAHNEMDRRCSSFEYQLQSACSECTAAVEEHVAGTLQGVKKRVDAVQTMVDEWKSHFEQEARDLFEATNQKVHGSAAAAQQAFEEIEDRMSVLQKQLTDAVDRNATLEARLRSEGERAHQAEAEAQKLIGQQSRKIERQATTIEALRSQGGERASRASSPPSRSSPRA